MDCFATVLFQHFWHYLCEVSCLADKSMCFSTSCSCPIYKLYYVHLLRILAQMLYVEWMCTHVGAFVISPVQRFCRDKISRCKPCSSVSCSCLRNMMLLSTLSTCLANALLSITTCGRFTMKKRKKVTIFNLSEYAKDPGSILSTVSVLPTFL